MFRRTTLGVLVLALLVLAASPAAAKGPTRLEIEDPQTGTTTVLDDSQNQFFQLMELVGWPEGRSAPPGLDSGALEHVATLSWTFDDKTPLWIDRSMRTVPETPGWSAATSTGATAQPPGDR